MTSELAIWAVGGLGALAAFAAGAAMTYRHRAVDLLVDLEYLQEENLYLRAIGNDPEDFMDSFESDGASPPTLRLRVYPGDRTRSPRKKSRPSKMRSDPTTKHRTCPTPPNRNSDS